MKDQLLLPPTPIHIERGLNYLESLPPHERQRLSEKAATILPFIETISSAMEAVRSLPPLNIDWLKFQIDLVREMQSNN